MGWGVSTTGSYYLYVVTVDGDEFEMIDSAVESTLCAYSPSDMFQVGKQSGVWVTPLLLFIPEHRISHWIWKKAGE